MIDQNDDISEDKLKNPLNIDHKNIVLGKCPKCKKGEIFDKGALYGCTKYPDCSFSITKELLTTKISSTRVKEILEDRITSDKIKFTTENKEDGQPVHFFCHLALKKEGEEYKLKFEYDVSLGKCPVCKRSEIHEFEKCYKCKNPECNAFAYKSYMFTPLKPSHIKKLLTPPNQTQLSIPAGKDSTHKRKVIVYLKDIFKKQ